MTDSFSEIPVQLSMRFLSTLIFDTPSIGFWSLRVVVNFRCAMGGIFFSVQNWQYAVYRCVFGTVPLMLSMVYSLRNPLIGLLSSFHVCLRCSVLSELVNPPFCFSLFSPCIAQFRSPLSSCGVVILSMMVVSRLGGSKVLGKLMSIQRRKNASDSSGVGGSRLALKLSFA